MTECKWGASPLLWDKAMLLPEKEAASVEARRRNPPTRRTTSLLLLSAPLVLLAILTTVVVLLVLVVLPMWRGGNNNNNNNNNFTAPPEQELERSCNGTIGGLYILERLGGDFLTYLRSLRIPKQVIQIIVRAGEVVEIKEGDGDRGEWNILVKTGKEEQVLILMR